MGAYTTITSHGNPSSLLKDTLSILPSESWWARAVHKAKRAPKRASRPAVEDDGDATELGSEVERRLGFRLRLRLGLPVGARTTLVGPPPGGLAAIAAGGLHADCSDSASLRV
jgi:hypothetical protein